MFAKKSRPPSPWLPRIRLPRSRHERHDFAMIAPQYTNSAMDRLLSLASDVAIILGAFLRLVLRKEFLLQ